MYFSFHDRMLLDILFTYVYKPNVGVTRVKRNKDEFGYTGCLYYQDKSFHFSAGIDDEKEYFLIDVFFPLIVDEQYRDPVERLIVLTNTIIKGEGSVSITDDRRIRLRRKIPLVKAVIVDYVDNTTRACGSIAFAFAPFFELLNSGQYPLETMQNKSAISRSVIELIALESNALKVIDCWIDPSPYSSEKWYRFFEECYDDYINQIDDNLMDYDYRKRFGNS